jgi:hypothetical protein
VASDRVRRTPDELSAAVREVLQIIRGGRRADAALEPVVARVLARPRRDDAGVRL